MHDDDAGHADIHRFDGKGFPVCNCKRGVEVYKRRGLSGVSGGASLGVIFLFLLLFRPQAFGVETERHVSFAIGYSLEPYVLANGRGVVSDIVRESLQASGYTLELVFLSNARAIEEFKAGRHDAVAVVTPAMVDAYLSVPFVRFHNQVISLAEQQLALSSLADLATRRVVGFSHARGYLGAEFASVVADNPDYREVERQVQQVEALFDGRADAIVADKTIFRFYQRKLQIAAPYDARFRRKVVFSDLFAPNEYYAAFHRESVRNAFNHGYASLQASGRIVQILRRYTDLMQRY